MVTNFNPAQLTTWGQRIFNGANGIRSTSREATVFGGGPTGSPTADAHHRAHPARRPRSRHDRRRPAAARPRTG